MNDTLEPEDNDGWVMKDPIDYTKMEDHQLMEQLREINDRLVEKKMPRPTITPINEETYLILDDEARDLHSRYFAVKHACYLRGMRDKDIKD